MAWDQLSINRPHLAYAIIGGFTSLFMLVSLFVKEKLYIGEATVATICGIIFGPYGFKLFDPSSWGNVDQITLECSRVVLVVQCFAVGVELPKKYMTRHWRSVFFLLVPVMTYGWLICSLFIWWMIPKLSWLESLTIAACVTATDPVLASSVVGKGKFAKRIPRHLRDLLSAESGCNDGMAFPFIYLSLYLIRYKSHTTEMFKHWFLLTVLYECLFGCVLGVALGYGGRQAIKFAERRTLIDRESFLAFYFVLALFCAGIGSMLGADDLLIGFCAGVAFSNDGWFAEKTEASHVSNVIDLLLNLSYFVYFGAIIPWSSYTNPEWGITPWRLIVIAIFVVLFRRIPIMVILKPLIPDIKTWREALFAGHFGPIGVGAIFVAILARAELETGKTTPLAELPTSEHEDYLLIQLIWPIVTFLVISSIIVHGSSIAVFTLGKHVNTMRLTMSYTTGNDNDTWLNRLPIIGSRAASMSFRKHEPSDSSNEKVDHNGLFPSGTLPPVGGLPGGLLSRASSRGRDDTRTMNDSTISPHRRKRGGLGRPVSTGRATPRAAVPVDNTERQDAIEPVEVYQEGRDIVIENEEGDVIALAESKTPLDHTGIGPLDTRALDKKLERTRQRLHAQRQDKENSDTEGGENSSPAKGKSSKRSKQKPIMAYRFDDNIIVEDADGEVIKRYKIPKSLQPDISERKKSNLVDFIPPKTLAKVGTWFGITKDRGGDSGSEGMPAESDDDEGPSQRIRFRDEKGRRLSKQEFFKELRKMDAHARKAMASEASLPDMQEGSSENQEDHRSGRERRRAFLDRFHREKHDIEAGRAGNGGNDEEETAAERKRREAALGIRTNEESDSDDDDGTPRDHNEVPGAPRARSRTPGIRFSNVEKREGVEVEISRPPSAGLMNASSVVTPSPGAEEEGGYNETTARNTALQWGDGVKGKQKEL